MRPRGWFLAVAMMATATPFACASRVVDSKPKPVVTQPATVSGELPCDVERILADVCRYCHTSPPRNGAPFSLATYADTQALVDGRPLYEFMGDAVLSKRMPLSPMSLDDDQRATLVAWAKAGGQPLEAGASCVVAAEEDAGRDAENEADVARPADDGGVDAADADAEP